MNNQLSLYWWKYVDAVVGGYYSGDVVVMAHSLDEAIQSAVTTAREVAPTPEIAHTRCEELEAELRSEEPLVFTAPVALLIDAPE